MDAVIAWTICCQIWWLLHKTVAELNSRKVSYKKNHFVYFKNKHDGSSFICLFLKHYFILRNSNKEEERGTIQIFNISNLK